MSKQEKGTHMNIRLLTLSGLAAVGVIAAASTAEVSVAAQMKQSLPVQEQAKNTPHSDQLAYGLGTNQATSCRAGRLMVAKHGFRHVRAVECMGSRFTYLGQRHGHKYKITLSSRTGQIARIKRA
jgi:hypothetical protein